MKGEGNRLNDVTGAIIGLTRDQGFFLPPGRRDNDPFRRHDKASRAISPMAEAIRINRAPVLTLWAAVVAKRLGLPWETALTCGQAIAGMTAYSKGVRLGIYASPVVPPDERGCGAKGVLDLDRIASLARRDSAHRR